MLLNWRTMRRQIVLGMTREQLLEWAVNKAKQLLRNDVILMPPVQWNGVCSGGGGGNRMLQ